MKLNKSLIVLLTVFMLILSASAVSADDSPDGGVAQVDDDDVKTADDVATDDNTDDGVDDGTDDGADDDAPEVVAAPDDDADGASSDAAESSSSNLSKYSTGNPIAVLLVAIASVGIASIRRK